MGTLKSTERYLSITHWTPDLEPPIVVKEGPAAPWELGEGGSTLGRDGRPVDALQMIDIEVDWLEHYPIVSIEDGLADEDWTHWPELMRRVGGRALVLGDDLLATNPERINFLAV